MALRVAFNARLLASADLRGWNRYTLNLLVELPALGVDLLIYSDRPLHEAHRRRLVPGSYTERVAPPMRYPIWEQRWLPRQCAADGADVLHCPMNFGLPWSSRCRRVLTLHDAIEQLYSPGRGPSRRRTQWSAISNWIARTRADRVITVSEHARTDLVRHLKIPADRVSVTYESADRRFHEEIPEADRARVRAACGVDRPYVFYVGGWERRKNIPFLVRAFAASGTEGIDLVLAGGKPEQRAALVDLAESLGVGDRLKLLGWVEDEDLPALYAGATCFAYPSEYEGFGLQLCEAMAAGCPTLAARATSLPEVLGGGGETFRLDDVGELAGQLRRIRDDPAHRADLARRARDRAADFSWRRTAEQTLEVYRAAIGRP